MTVQDPNDDALLERLQGAFESVTVDPGPSDDRRLERLKRKLEEPAGFWETAGTTGRGTQKTVWDFVPFVATGRAGIGWADLYNAAEAMEGGYQTQEQRESLEDFLDWTQRERSFMGGVGGISGEALPYIGEMATGFGITTALGKGVMKTAGGKMLGKTLERMASKRMAQALQKNVATATLGKLVKGGAGALAAGAATEVLNPEYGGVMADARRELFERNFEISEDEAGKLLVTMQEHQSTLVDVLPQAILGRIIEYTSEGVGAGIPFAAKLDALTDSLLAKLVGKVGMEKASAILKKGGVHGMWAEIGEEYSGAFARQQAFEADEEKFQGFEGSLEETFDSTLEMYVSFGLMRGATGAAARVLGGKREQLDTIGPELDMSQYDQEGAESGASIQISPEAGAPAEGLAPSPLTEEEAFLAPLEEQPGAASVGRAEEQQAAAAAEVQEGLGKAKATLETLPSKTELKLDQMEEGVDEGPLPTKEDFQRARETGATERPGTERPQPSDDAELRRMKEWLAETRARVGVADMPEREVGTPQEEQVAEAASLERFGEVNDQPIRKAEPRTPAHQVLSLTSEILGGKIVWAEGDSPMRRPAAVFRPGEMVVDVNATDPAQLVWHESVHLMAKGASQAYRDLFVQVSKLDKAGLRAAGKVYELAFGPEMFRALPSDVKAEESLAQYTQGLTAYMEYLSTEKGQRSVRQLLAKDRGLVQKLLDAVRKVLNAMRSAGAQIPLTHERRLQRLSEALGREATELEAETALEVHSALMEAAPAVRESLGQEPLESEAAAVEPVEATEGQEGEGRFAAAPPTDSPEFRRWFGDSKVVDAKGEPLVVYHGSAVRGITEFDPERSGSVRTEDWGKGIYFTPSEGMAEGYREVAAKQTDPEGSRLWDEYNAEAKRLGTTVMMAGIDLGRDSSEYALLGEYETRWRARLKEIEEGGIGEVYGAYVSLQNPYVYSYQGITDPYLGDLARSRGHDGMMIQTAEGELEEVVVFNPADIKSTGNRGTYDPTDPDIRFAAAPPTDSPEFRRWFSGSQVVDAKGEPLVVYHGTGEWFSKFRMPAFFSTAKSAESYARFAEETRSGVRRLLPVYLAIRNPATDTDVFRAAGVSLDDPNLEPAFQYITPGHQVDSGRDEGFAGRVIERLRKQGFDGVFLSQDYIALEDEVAPSYVVFSPTQIKSATGNVGTYDPADPDIRFAAKARSTEEFRREFFELPQEGRLDALRRVMEDKHIRVRQFVAHMGSFRPIVDETNIGQALDLMDGRIESRLNDLHRDYVEKMRVVMRRSKMSLEDAGRYLYARHAPERNEWGLEKDPEGEWHPETKPFSGLPTSQAEAEVAEREKEPGFKAIGELVDGMNNQARQRMYDYGLISKGTFDLWESIFSHYVPLADPEAETDTPFPVRSAGVQVRGPETKEAKGRVSEVDSEAVFLNSLRQASTVVARGEKNRIGQKMAALLRETQLAEFTQLDTLPEGREERDEALEHSFIFKEHGEEVVIQLGDERLARALKNLGVQHLGGPLRLLAALNRFKAFMVTSVSPSFVLTNYLRDIQAGLINLNEEQAKGIGKQVSNVLLNPLAGFPAVRAAYKLARGVEDKSEWGESAREFSDHGGATGFWHQKNYEQTSADIQKALKRGSMGEARVKSLAAISDVNKAFENATRLATFHFLRKAGYTAEKAAEVAKNLTVNFNRRGEAGSTINALYLFANAGIQGSVRMMKATRNPKVQKLLGGVFVAGVVMDVVMRAMAGDDDDGRNFYDKIPDYEKDRNYIIMLPGGDYIKIPMPYGYSVIHNAGRIASEYAAGEKSEAGAVGGMFTAMLENFNPIGGADLRTFWMPTAGKPALEILINRKFSGAPIAPEDNPWGPADPEHTKYFSTVYPPTREFTKWLAELFGGDSVQPGGIEVSPEHIDHIIDHFGGGLLTFAKKSSEFFPAVAKSVSSGSLEPIMDYPARNVPVWRRFYGNQSPWVTAQEFYTALDEIERARSRVKAYPGMAAELRPLTSLHSRATSKAKGSPGARTQASELQKRARRTEDIDERKRLEQQRTDVMNRFLRTYYRATEKD